MPTSTSERREAIRARAMQEGFDVVRITRAIAPPESGSRLQTYLAEGRHGAMDWMANNADRRADPAVLWPEAKSIIVLGANYGPDHDPLDDVTSLVIPGRPSEARSAEDGEGKGIQVATAIGSRKKDNESNSSSKTIVSSGPGSPSPRASSLRSKRSAGDDSVPQSPTGAISVYARGDDYHDVLKKRLKRLGLWLCEQFGGEAKMFVDTAPVLEKTLAQQAGLGWQGKHTNLVSRDFGSWLFLGSLFTTLDIEPDASEPDHCGACHACLDICPTAAFPAPYQLDARRCISYLTIEHKGHIPREFREAIGNRIYGCDDCLAVCPWNKFAKLSREAKFAARAELQRPALSELVRLDDTAFRTLFRASPIKRIGRDRFVRNVLIAIGNSGDAALAADAERLLTDPSPLVRAMAVWACGKLLEAKNFSRLRERYLPQEIEEEVRVEWAQCVQTDSSP